MPYFLEKKGFPKERKKEENGKNEKKIGKQWGALKTRALGWVNKGKKKGVFLGPGETTRKKSHSGGQRVGKKPKKKGGVRNIPL